MAETRGRIGECHAELASISALERLLASILDPAIAQSEALEMSAGYPFAPDWVSPPGETIREVMAHHRVTVTALAGKMKTSTAFIWRLLKGDESITAATALELEAALGIPARFWLNLEAQYRAGLEKKGE